MAGNPSSYSIGTGNSGGGFWQGLGNMFKGGNGMFSNVMDSLALGGQLGALYKSLGIQEDQLGLMKGQDARAARADNTNFANQQFMANQMNGGLAGVMPDGMTPDEQMNVSP